MKKILTITMILLGAIAMRAERVALINDVSQLKTNHLTAGEYSNLIDNNVSTSFHCGGYGLVEDQFEDSPYLEVELPEPLTLADDEDLVVFLQRVYTDTETKAHVTTMRVDRSSDGVNWEPWDDAPNNHCHVYFLYRGKQTKEYSSRLHTKKPIKKLRFTVTANSGRATDKEGHRYMSMAEFQVYKVGRTDNYSDTWTDRLHLTTDYKRGLENYEFVNTQGILNYANRQGGRNGSIATWTDWNAWKDGKWTKDKAILDAAGIQMPDYSFITSQNDNVHGYLPDPGQVRQPTHVTEHILYAIPGDAIALYPYYQFTGTTAYYTNFSHWYDYRTGGNVYATDPTTGVQFPLLDFLIDPAGIHKSDKYGYFAATALGNITGKAIPEDTQTYQHTISTAQEYVDFVTEFNKNAAYGGDIELTADLDFTGFDNVPSIEIWGSAYSGKINGNGHTIRNLKMNRPNETNVALIKRAGNGCRITNLIIDESCEFIGMGRVAALIGEENWANGISIENVQCYATVTALGGTENGQYDSSAALIASKGDGWNSSSYIKNCLVGGVVNGPDAVAVAYWKTDYADDKGNYQTPNFRIENTVSTTIVNSGNPDGAPFSNLPQSRLINCIYGDKLPEDLNGQELEDLLGYAWVKDEKGHVVPPVDGKLQATIEANINEHYGKIATFFCPRNPYVDEGALQSLPFPPGQDEFVIAADFSQSYSNDYNLVHTQDGGKIIEPSIAFRHIFRIRDGRQFAEEFSGSVENNLEYVRKNTRRVSARANVPFQIRLDSPVPRTANVPSKYYYKISNSDYRRINTMNIEVIDQATGQTVQKSHTDANGNLVNDFISIPGNSIFYYGEEFDGMGSRSIDGVDYNICGGGGKYFRMLKNNDPLEGHYTVRITGNDVNGNLIKIYNTETPLIVMEMDLIIMPESAASVVEDSILYSDDKYKHAREEELETEFGLPRQTMNFDEYMALTKLPNVSDYLDGSGNQWRLKWPLSWNSVTYSFDYNETRDFNQYMIGSSAHRTPYNASAAAHVNPDGSVGLNDRLFYKTFRKGQTPQYGFFYYVNASTDPGVMARLRLDDLCMGSTIHVSAWVSEFSAVAEVANVSFNFIAVLKQSEGGDRIPLHSFITGYVDTSKLGSWMNVYYSFVPNYSSAGLNPDMIDHYELELDNNCKSSNGADYAVDNIRMYVTSPVIQASQSDAMCDSEVQEMTVSVETPFDVMLQVLGEKEASAEDQEVTKLYYTFIDKEKFDKIYKETGESTRAYEEAVLRYNYENGGLGDQTYGKVSFNLHFDSNPDYDKDNINQISTTSYKKVDKLGRRLIGFNARPSDKQLRTGKEYYVSIYAVPENIDIVPTWGNFDINDPCAKFCVFRVNPTSVIKIDGEVRENADNITCCENQKPVVQVDILEKKNDGSTTPFERNARLDWYMGSFVDFQTETFMLPGKDKPTPLSDLMTILRSEYEDAENMNLKPKGQLTQEMIDTLKDLTTTIRKGEISPRLILSKTSYVFPPTVVPEGQDFVYQYVVAIPISKGNESIRICTSPTEVRMKVQHTAPMLYHGLRSSIPYPETMTDVPLRVGLRQLLDVSTNEGSASTFYKRLIIPVRSVFKATEHATEMKRIVTNPYISLVETNDPEYLDLGTIKPDDKDAGTLLVVGEIATLKGLVNDPTKENNFEAVFYNSFNFKEGYYYRMRFMFEEQTTDKPEEDAPLCLGQEVFTIKVVPEYVRWKGGEGNVSLNWNNDANWERVTYKDLFPSGVVAADRKTDLDRYVTDGSNKSGRSYAPLYFTKAIIPAGGVFPRLGEYTYQDFSSDFSGFGTVNWTSDPSADKATGDATADIQYDMAAHTQGLSILCRPWYANTCEQVHFRPESEILNQDLLNYQKAWVDIEVAPTRWYTLSTPLQKVYAGDFYLPTAGARQETELFKDINFEPGTHNRFRPAVYQRGWNKSNATVFEIKNGPSRNVAVKANWSNVYNDVAEAYGEGTGFSIKTDVSMLDKAPKDGKILFRLPKSDISFNYYNQDGSVVGNNTYVGSRDDSFRLNNVDGNVVAVTTGGNQYFLVGNPFMAHLDMKKFLEANKDKITQKYWILTDGSQLVSVFDENSDGYVGNAPGYVAPMQGFFVEADAEQTQGAAAIASGRLELSYAKDMAFVQSFSDAPLRSAATRSEAYEGPVMISAVRDGQTVSQAFLNISVDAEKKYDRNNDVILLDNTDMDIPAMVYTVDDNTAMSINSTDSADGTEIGLIATDDQPTLLRFEGVDAHDDLVLFDTATGQATPIYDGMEYTVEGAVAGRLFINSGIKPIEDLQPDLRVSVDGGHVKIESATGEAISANVFTMDGIVVRSLNVDGQVLEFDLEKGIYVIEASDGVKKQTKKIVI